MPFKVSGVALSSSDRPFHKPFPISMSKRDLPSSRDQPRASGRTTSTDADELPQPDDAESGSGSKVRRIKIIISTLLVFHLAAVVLPPLAFQTLGVNGPSPLVGTLIIPFSGYGQFLHMDRGYAFFAPNPGPSHLVQAAFTAADGTITERMYPNLDDQWPRLLYHRHFMLTEYLNESYYPPVPDLQMFEDDQADALDWQQRRERYEYIRQSMVDHLKHENDGRAVAIRRIEHGVPGLQDFREEPISLTDPRLYSVLLDQSMMEEDVAAETNEEIPASQAIDDPQSLPKENSAPANNPDAVDKPSSVDKPAPDAESETSETQS